MAHSSPSGKDPGAWVYMTLSQIDSILEWEQTLWEMGQLDCDEAEHDNWRAAVLEIREAMDGG